MPEILHHGTPPVRHMFKTTCSCGTVARFHEDEADRWHINRMTDKPVRTPWFECPVCDGLVPGVEDGVVEDDYSVTEIGRFFDVPIHSRKLWKRLQRAQADKASTDALWAILEEELP